MLTCLRITAGPLKSGCSSTVEHQLPELMTHLLTTKRTFEPVVLNVAFGS